MATQDKKHKLQLRAEWGWGRQQAQQESHSPTSLTLQHFFHFSTRSLLSYSIPYRFTLPCKFGCTGAVESHRPFQEQVQEKKKRFISACFSKEQAGPMSCEPLSGKLSKLGPQETQSHTVKGGANRSSRRLSKMVLWRRLLGHQTLRAPSNGIKISQ